MKMARSNTGPKSANPNSEGADAADLIAAAAVRLAGTGGWRALTLADIAAEAGLPLSELARHYGSRPEILDGFERMIDRLMLAGGPAGDISDAPRDRLFEVVMERLDALAPYRDGIRRIARELPLDPQSGLVLACALPRSVAWMYASARIAIDGPLMPLRIAALGGAYLATLRVWLNDDGPDLAKTMAALDRQLDRAKRLISGDFGPKRPGAPAPAAEPPQPETPPDLEMPARRRTPSRTARGAKRS
jgi:AcrR family transcriptional regulator